MTPSAFTIAFTEPATDDFSEIMEWSAEQFGMRAADRYEALIVQTLADIAEDPFRVGAKPRPELHDGLYSYHLASSRERIPSRSRVKSPRHFVLYRVDSRQIEVLRILHDSREVEPHLPVLEYK